MLAVIRGEEIFPLKHCSDTVPQLTEIYDFWHVRIKEDHLKYVEENVAHLYRGKCGSTAAISLDPSGLRRGHGTVQRAQDRGFGRYGDTGGISQDHQ